MAERRLKTARSAATAALIVMASMATASADQAHDAHGEAARDAVQGSRPMMSASQGAYAMSREASGTSGSPTPRRCRGQKFAMGEWSGMVHGSFHYVATDQRGLRGDSDTYSANMLMAMIDRPVGDGRFGARGMLTLEPDTIGNEGYPVLLQTGEVTNVSRVSIGYLYDFIAAKA